MKAGMPPVKASPLEPAAFAERFATAAARAGFRRESLAEVAGVPLAAYTRRGNLGGPRRRLYLSAGIHGDEPAPPLALLELMLAQAFSFAITWFIVPLLNPTGYRTGARENAAGVDLNRDYRQPLTDEVRGHVHWLRHQPPFDLALCLHEDWESQGAYLYELNPQHGPSLARPLLAALTSELPVESGAIVDGRPVSELGIIRPLDDPALRDTWPEAIYLIQEHTALGYTTETPSHAALEARIRAQTRAVQVASTHLLGSR
jgi:murein peptide amidase A